MSPLVRRTLAPRGQTPILVQPGRHRHKVSSIAALSISPHRQRLGLHVHLHRNQAIDHYAAATFLRQLLRNLRQPVTVIWDQGRNHQGPALRQLQTEYPRLRLEPFPAYAPELNPVESLWTHLKWHRLPNCVPRDVLHLEKIVSTELCQVRLSQQRLRSFFDSSQLPFPTRALAS